VATIGVRGPQRARPVGGSGDRRHARPYLFAWAGDTAGEGEDFIAVIDSDPASPGYGKLVTSAASGTRRAT
jgi:hypothetical protein